MEEILEIHLLKPHPRLPRFSVNRIVEGEIDDTRENGFFEAVCVREIKGLPDPEYEILSGVRSWVVAQAAGITEVPVQIMKGVSDEMADQFVDTRIAANDPISKAQILRDQLDADPLLNVSRLAKRLGEQQGTISNRLGLLRLDYSVQRMVKLGELSEGQARVMKVLPKNSQYELALLVVRDSLSVRSIEKIVAAYRQSNGLRTIEDLVRERESLKSKPRRKKTEPASITELGSDVENYLSEKLGCGVSIENGKLAINFYDNSEILEGVLEHLGYQSD